MKKFFSIIAIFCFIVPQLHSQEQPVSKYDPHELFNPLFYKEHGNQLRTGNGEPGVAYWQNRADYQIAASINEEKNHVSGTVTLTYTNNSPHQLGFIWMQLDQNLFNPNSRGYAKLPPTGRSRYGNASNPFLRLLSLDSSEHIYITFDHYAGLNSIYVHLQQIHILRHP